ncbi:MAG: hypothetical protein ACOYO1_18060 [Bacteroidales bacterium]
MKQLTIIIFVSIIFLLAFSKPNNSISIIWDTKTLLILDEVSKGNINKEEIEIFNKIISNRNKTTHLKMDSFYNTGLDFIYISEDLDIKTHKITRTEKYFSQKFSKFDIFYSLEKKSIDSIQIPNFKFINDTIANLTNCHDNFYKENMSVILNYWDTLPKFCYVSPVIESVIVTPGCTGTKWAIESEEKKLLKKNPKTLLSTNYKIESLINKGSIKISYQIPKKTKPIIHVISTTF